MRRRLFYEMDERLNEDEVRSVMAERGRAGWRLSHVLLTRKWQDKVPGYERGCLVRAYTVFWERITVRGDEDLDDDDA